MIRYIYLKKNQNLKKKKKMEAVPRTTGIMTELLRRITVPQIASEEGTQRVLLLHQLLCRKLEPQLRQAVSVLQQMEGLEGDRLMMLQRGEHKKADEVLNIINNLMDSVDLIGKERSNSRRIPNHTRGFCAAVSASPAKGKRCLPAVSRNRTPDATPSKLVMTKTGLTTTPPATSAQRSRDINKSKRTGSAMGRKSPSATASAPPVAVSHQILHSPPKTVNSLHMDVNSSRIVPSISPQRPVTPMHQPYSTLSTIATPMSQRTPSVMGMTSPRRDREFILALLRSLQLDEFAHLFGDMSLLSFYRLTLTQLQQLGLPEAAQSTLYNSIDQIKQIADNTLSPARSSHLT